MHVTGCCVTLFCAVVVVAHGYAMLYSNSGGTMRRSGRPPTADDFSFSSTVGVFFRVTAAAAATRLAVHRKDFRVK
jgi:hypothetical protein